MTHCDVADCPDVFLSFFLRSLGFLIRHFANRQFLVLCAVENVAVFLFANYYFFCSFQLVDLRFSRKKI